MGPEEAGVAEVEVAAETTTTSKSKKKRKKKGNKAEASSVEQSLVGEDDDILFRSTPAEGAAADGKQPSGNASEEAAAPTSPLSPAAPAEQVTTWSLILQTNLCKKDEAVLRAEAEKVYAAADVNGDGGLSKTEMKKVIQKDPGLRAKLVSGSWKDFFAVLDKDGDGTVDPDEFIKFYIHKLSTGNEATLYEAPAEEAAPAAKTQAAV